MDKIFYNPNTGGFYRTSVHGDNIPDKSIEITESLYKELFLGQSSGKLIVPSVTGMPELREYVVSPAELEEQERNWRNLELCRADIELYKVQDSDMKAKGSVSDWRVYRKLLRAWPENEYFPNKEFRPIAPDLK